MNTKKIELKMKNKLTSNDVKTKIILNVITIKIINNIILSVTMLSPQLLSDEFKIVNITETDDSIDTNTR